MTATTIMKVRIGSKTEYEIPFNTTAYEEEKPLFERIGDWFSRAGQILLSAYTWERVGGKLMYAAAPVATTPAGVDQMREGFQKVIDVFTAVAEPILWGYAVVGLVMVATGKKQAGWDRVKSVGWSYLLISMLPTFFALLRWMATTLKGAIQF